MLEGRRYHSRLKMAGLPHHKPLDTGFGRNFGLALERENPL